VGYAVGWRYDADDDVIVVVGHKLERTKKFRDARRSGRAALVIDDLENITPWRPRGVEVRGRPRRSRRVPAVIRIHPRANRVVGPDGAGRGARTVTASRRAPTAPATQTPAGERDHRRGAVRADGRHAAQAPAAG
jgi:pyridoxamine 5'-phosphate oxidase family protein